MKVKERKMRCRVKILEATSNGDSDQKPQTVCTLIMSIGTEWFGVTEKHVTSIPARPNWQEIKISQLRQEQKSLRRQFKAAKEEERTALSELGEILRRRLITLSQAEWHQRKGPKAQGIQF